MNFEDCKMCEDLGLCESMTLEMEKDLNFQKPRKWKIIQRMYLQWEQEIEAILFILFDVQVKQTYIPTIS